MNIKKKLGILLIAIVAVSGLIGYYRVSYAGNLETVTEGISESIINYSFLNLKLNLLVFL